MSDQKSEEDKNEAFKLSKKKVNFELDLQQDAYARLNALYHISKLLSEFGSVEATFPKILTSAAKTFPLLTAVLIDNWEKKPKTTIWHSELADHEQVIAATLNARETFSFLKGTTSQQSSDLTTASAKSNEFNSSSSSHTNENQPDNYIVLPLIIDKLMVIGALQLEGAGPLSEQDLQFVDAFANLIAIALDRFYKSQREHDLQQLKNEQHSARLAGSQEKVTSLESERDLREDFVSLLTHDLRTPLAAAKMASQLILKQDVDRTTINALAERIAVNVSRADQMISNLLDANRIRSGEMLTVNSEKFDLVVLIQDILQDLKMAHGDRFFLNSPKEVIGYWDKKQIQRVLENLLNNAIKYGDPKKPITITLALEQNNQNVSFAVQNFGNIISAEEQKSIFTQFRRTKEAQAGSKKGWGIGLTLVKGMVEAHGGRVEVTSDLDSGTVFTVRLPKDARGLKTTQH